MSWKPKRAPTTESLCTVMGIAIGFLLMPTKVNYQPTDFKFLMGMLWIIGGATAGALIGTIIAWIDRRIATGRRRPRTGSSQEPHPTERVEPCQAAIFPAADFLDLDFLANF